MADGSYTWPFWFRSVSQSYRLVRVAFLLPSVSMPETPSRRHLAKEEMTDMNNGHSKSLSTMETGKTATSPASANVTEHMPIWLLHKVNHGLLPIVYSLILSLLQTVA